MWRGFRGALLVAGGLLVLVACLSNGTFGSLPSQDQDAFFRCRNVMQPTICGDDRDLVYVTNCIRNAEAHYSDGRTTEARQSWLVANGCPPPMVYAYGVAHAGPPPSAHPAVTADGTLEVHPDPSTGRTQLRATLPTGPSRWTFRAAVGDRVAIVEERIVPSNAEICHTMEVRADNASAALPDATFDLRTESGDTIATTSSTMSIEDLTRVAGARDLRFRVCGVITTLTPGQIATIRRFVDAYHTEASRLPPPPAPPTEPPTSGGWAPPPS